MRVSGADCAALRYERSSSIQLQLLQSPILPSHSALPNSIPQSYVYIKVPRTYVNHDILKLWSGLYNTNNARLKVWVLQTVQKLTTELSKVQVQVS